VRSLPLLAAALLLAACGGSGSPSATTAPTTSAAATAVAPTTATTTAGTHDVALWFLAGSTPTRTTETAPQVTAVAFQALQLLVAGPTTTTLTTAIPIGTTALRATNTAGVLTAGLSSELAHSKDVEAARGQVVRTMLEFRSVKWVQVRAGGHDVGGLQNADMLASGRDHAPWIELLQAQEIGGRVAYFGTADVFEATVQVRLVSHGAVLAARTSTATCGTGCRGTFRGTLKVPAGASDLVVEAYSVSAKDGSEQNLVRLPVS
jgi:hypothetical protein